jgi:uncharacterized membrane protein
MLAATEGTDELLQNYDVAFVVIGPTELDRYAANEAYWLENHELVLESDSHKVFAVTPLDRREPRVVGEPPTTPEPSPGR